MPSLDSSTQEEKKKANSYAIQHVPSLLFMKIVEIHCAILFLIEIPNVSGGSWDNIRRDSGPCMYAVRVS